VLEAGVMFGVITALLLGVMFGVITALLLPRAAPRRPPRRAG
jgi:hypothetical protein